MRTYGLIDPPPHIIVADLPTHRGPGAATHVVERLRQTLRTGGYDRVGIAACEPAATPGSHRAVVALVDSKLELTPIPRELSLGESVHVEFRLLGIYEQIQLVVASPDARVQAVKLSDRGRGYRARLRCEQTGMYRVEVTGIGRHGDEVLANFPVYCGQRAPETVTYRAARLFPRSAAAAEREVFELTNEYRLKVGLRALRFNEALSHVAREHGVDMMRGGYVGHVSPSSGSPADRLQRAGIPYLVVRENIARAYSVGEALQELINSPAHRANLLSSDVTDLGVGVVIDRRDSLPVLLVTQDFARTAEPFSQNTAPEVLLARINRRRRAARTAALVRRPELDRLARAFLDDVLARDDAAARARLGRALSGERRYARVQALVAKVNALEAFEAQDQLEARAMTDIGLAVRRVGDDIVIVALLGEAVQ